MNLILSAKCCGKTCLAKLNPQYIDFDVFVNITKHKEQLVKDIIKVYSENISDNRIYLMNINAFCKWELYKNKNLKVSRIILPSLCDVDYKYANYLKRERKEMYYIIKNKDSLIKHYLEAYNNAQKYFSGIEIEELKPEEYLSDVL